MRKISTLLLTALLLSTGFFVLMSTSTGVARAASPAAYVPVTLTNSQTTATPVNFDQLVKVDWSTYSTYLNSNVSNVRFYNSTTLSSSYELSGWIEDNNTTTAISSNVWVNLSGTIVPASGTATIYMAFLGKASSWSSHWGLAPQLSATYGEFDNGASVFSHYWRFGGLSALPSPWTLAYDSGAGVFHATNYEIGENGNDGGIVTTGSYDMNGMTFTVGYVLPVTTATTGAVGGIGIGAASSPGSGFIGGGGGIIGGSTGTVSLFYNNNGQSGKAELYIAGTQEGSTVTYQTTVGRWSVGSDGTTSYGNFNASSTSYPQSFPTGPLAIFATSGIGGAPDVYWAMSRYTPPVGVMPAASFGTLTTVSSAGRYQISFRQTSLPSTTEWGIRLSNTTAVIWQNSTAKYDNLTGLAPGSYTFRVINATGYAPNLYTGLLTIVSANLTQSLVFTGYAATFTELGLPAGVEWFVNLTNQPGLSESSTGQHLSTIASSVDATLPNATYTFTWQDKMNAEYHGGSSSFTVNGAAVSESAPFTAVLYYVNFTGKGKPPSVAWDVNLSNATEFTTGQGIQFSKSRNISFSVTNGTYYYNASADNSTAHMPLGWWRLTNAAGIILLHNISTFGGVKLIVNGANNPYNNITFARAYNITFEETGIGNAYTWTDSLYNTITTSAQSKVLTVANSATTITYSSTEGNWTNGSYAITVQTLVSGRTGTRYQNFSAFSSLSVAGSDLILPVNFITQYFLTIRSVPAAGGYHSPYSEWVNASAEVTLSAQPNSSYEFTGFVGTNTSSYTGPGSYSGGQYLATILITNPITENMTFGNYLVLTFYMQNLSTGTEWGIDLTDGSGLMQWDNGTGDYIVFELEAGTYTYTVTGVTSYPQTNMISVSGSETILLQYQVSTYPVSFQEAGLPAGQPWTVSVASSQYTFTQSSVTANVDFRLTNGTYAYSAGSVYGYMSNNSSGGFSISGAVLTVYVDWTEGNLFILEGIRYFVPIFLNTTNFTIPAGTQIPLNINWTKYQKYENQNLSNVMILNSTFYPLYSWMEDNASSLDTSSTVWTKLQTGITYYSSQLLYLVFMQDQRNNLNKVGYWGEAPQLSPLYGEWNNIGLVMNPGLLVQIYANATAEFLSSPPAQSILLNANYTTGSSLYYGGNMYVASAPYTRTAAQGSQLEVYKDSQGTYISYASEQHVLISYQTAVGGYPGTWPSPPIVPTSSAQTWFAKAQGFAEQNQMSVTWYSMDDDGAYLTDSVGGYLNSNWTRGTPLMDKWQSGGTSLVSAVSSQEGTSRISFLYAEINSGQAMWQFWTSAPVSYYSPSPVNRLPSIGFGTPGSSYSSFTEYGLPSGTTWAIGIDNEILQSNSNVIYDYLPTGTYFFTVGSLANDTFLSGIDGSFFPTPGQGFLTVNTFFTSQVILWTHANIKTYDLIPSQASAAFKNSILNITMPVFVTDVSGLPANTTTIATIWSHLQLRYVSKLQSQDFNVSWSFGNSGLGMFAVFFSLTKAQVNDIKNGTAIVSMVSAFRFGTFTSLATGVAGVSSFNGINTSSPTNPPPNILGLAPPPSSANLGSIQGIINYLGYLGQSAAGRSLYFIAVFLAVAYYVLRINNENIKKTKKKQA